MDDAEEKKRAIEWLGKCGLECSPGEKLVKSGRSPDFFCSGALDLWVELKRLGDEQKFLNFSSSFDEVRRQFAKIKGYGRGLAYISTLVTAGDISALRRLTQRTLEQIGKLPPGEEVAIVIPKDPIKRQFIRFRFRNEESWITIASQQSESGVYDIPYSLIPDTYEILEQEIKIFNSQGESTTRKLLNVLTRDDKFVVAMHVIPDASGFYLLSGTPTGVASKIKTVPRIRGLVADANQQLRNGQNSLPAPGIVLVFHESLLAGTEKTVISALYGDLQYSFPKENFQDGKLLVSGNGAWNSTKNRASSAFIYIPNGSAPIIVYNKWAIYSLPTLEIPGRHIRLMDNGEFETFGDDGDQESR